MSRSEAQIVPVWVAKGYGGATYVAGVYQRRTAFHKAVKALGSGLERPSLNGGVFGRGQATAILVPEPTNPHDPNAILVRLIGEDVGYLPREIAAAYSAVLRPLAERGQYVSVHAQLGWATGGTSNEYDVGLALPRACLMLPSNAAPSASSLALPASLRVKVTGGESRETAVASYVATHGEAMVYGTLHEVTFETARSRRSSVGVSIDGHPVGNLSPKVSEAVLGVVRRAAERGVTLTTETYVKGNDLETDVLTWITNTTDLSPEWLKALDKIPGTVRADAAPVAPTPAPVQAAEPVLVPSEWPAPVQMVEPMHLEVVAALHAAPRAADLPPAGWFPNPDDATQWRYWDGANWTDHRAPR